MAAPLPGPGNRPSQRADELSWLIAATARGDRLAFSALYQKTGAHLFALLLRMLKRKDLAEEALQDSYLKIWQNADRYQCEKGTALTWLLSIARYRALDQLRARRPETAWPENDSETDGLSPALRDASADPSAAAVDLERMSKLAACMDELSGDQRNSVLLAYYQGYTHPELAQRLKAPLGTVKSWVRRGLAQLRACLDR
ncbi:MAG: sigma-70 family RNA polymerase sigma factor [Panacagrimonas sp.]